MKKSRKPHQSQCLLLLQKRTSTRDFGMFAKWLSVGRHPTRVSETPCKFVRKVREFKNLFATYANIVTFEVRSDWLFSDYFSVTC